MRALFLALVVAVVAVPASAADATLAKVSGPVSVLPQGAKKFVAAKGGEELLYGDVVKVGKGGVAQLVLKERGAVLLREETLMSLQGNPRNTRLSFDFGEFLIGLKKKLGKGESFRVRTPAAVAAVRGTLFWGKSDKADKSTTYAGFGHTIAVTAGGKTVVVGPGKKLTVAMGAAPSEAQDSGIGLDYAKNFAVDGGLQGVETLSELK